MPVQLGCCPDAPRCLLCPPPPEPPTPDLVEALVHHYAVERAAPDDHVEVAFFGGAAPSPALLEAAAPHPVRVRVRPDLLSRADAAGLAERQVTHVELDALSFHDLVLRDFGRRYRGRLVREQLEGLASLGFSRGLVLAPGLPGLDHAGSVADAHEAVGRVETVRLHPVQVFAEAGLREAHMSGVYVPLSLGETVTVCRAMMDVLDGGGVEVIRVGINAGPDGYGRSVAGPRHPALRQLVEARRTLEVLHALLETVPSGSSVTLRCAPADETRTRGPMNQHIRTLRAAHELDTLTVVADASLPRGQWRVQSVEESR